MSIRVAVAGLGYFSQFHLEAWAADPRVELVGLADPDMSSRDRAAHWGPPVFADADTMLKAVDPDVVDIVAPPPAHAELVRAALKQGRLIQCQKPFCTSLAEAEAVIAEAKAAGARIVIHENFRFQPWYRRIKRMLDADELGQVWQARFSLKPGDGRGPRAYLDRQPGFQKMTRFLVHETAVHFVDTFRWLLGDITDVYADLRQLNPAMAGEDAGVLLLGHTGGARSNFDGNRLVDHAADNHRFTMGELEIEAEAGVLRMDGAGRLMLRPFGSNNWRAVDDPAPKYPPSFGGGCVANTINHVTDHLDGRGALENEAADYVHVLKACEAAYLSASEGRRVMMSEVD